MSSGDSIASGRSAESAAWAAHDAPRSGRIGRMRSPSPHPARRRNRRQRVATSVNRPCPIDVLRPRARARPPPARRRRGGVRGVLDPPRHSRGDGVRARRSHRLRLVRAVPQARRVAVHARLSRQRRAHRRGPEGVVAPLRLRPDLLGRPRPRPGSGDRAPLRDEGPARRLAVAQRDRERRRTRRGDQGRERGARRDPRDHRRQRGPAARRTAAAGHRRSCPQRPRGDGPAGDLRRCVGVLAQVSRGRARRRLHHDPHPAVLGGRAGRDRPCDHARRRHLPEDAGAPSRAATS